MKKIAFIVATVALIFSSCSSSDNSYEGPSYQVLPPVGVAETKVNIMDGSEVKGTLDVQNVDIPEEPQYLTGSSKSKSIAGVVAEEGEQGYFYPGGVQEPLVVEGLKPVQTENELAYLRTAIPEAEVVQWDPYIYGTHDMWPWYYHNIDDYYYMGVMWFEPNAGSYNDGIEHYNPIPTLSFLSPCVGKWTYAYGNGYIANAYPSYYSANRVNTEALQDMEEVLWFIAPSDITTNEIVNYPLKDFKIITTPTNATYWCFDVNGDGDYTNAIVLVEPSHAANTPEEIEGEVVCNIHQQVHTDWSEIKTSVHIRAAVETVEVTIPIGAGYMAEQDDFAIRTYEAYYTVGNAQYPVTVEVSHNADNLVIKIGAVTAKMIAALEAESNDGLTIEVHSYTNKAITDAEAWQKMKGSTIKVGYNKPTTYGKITSAIFTDDEADITVLE